MGSRRLGLSSGAVDPAIFFAIVGAAVASAPASYALLRRGRPAPMNLNGVWGVLSFTFREAMRTKWLIVFSAVFFLIAVNIPVLLLSVAYGVPPAFLVSNLGLTTALSFTFPLIPLLALPFGAVSIVEDRESGVLQYLLSNPITKSEFFLGRSAGLLLATSTVVLISFGGAAVAVYTSDSSESAFIVITMLIAMLLNAVMLALALIISEITKRKVTAMGIGLFFWFLFTTVSDLGIFVQAVDYTIGPVAGVLLVLLNPVETSRLIMVLAANLGTAQLGPTGFVASHVLGSNFFGVILGSVVIWFAVLTTAGFLVFMHQDAA
jgi:ABC-type transport system involved in multi-copper enzyme maturation permease subunit